MHSLTDSLLPVPGSVLDTGAPRQTLSTGPWGLGTQLRPRHTLHAQHNPGECRRPMKSHHVLKTARHSFEMTLPWACGETRTKLQPRGQPQKTGQLPRRLVAHRSVALSSALPRWGTRIREAGRGHTDEGGTCWSRPPCAF